MLLAKKKSKGLDISRVIYDLIVCGIRGEIKKDALLSTLAELASTHKDIASITLDVFQVLDTETQLQNEYSAKERSLFGSIRLIHFRNLQSSIRTSTVNSSKSKQSYITSRGGSTCLEKKMKDVPAPHCVIEIHWKS